MLDAYYHKQEPNNAYEVFRSKGFAPDWMISTKERTPIAMGSLPPFLRALLVIDGTVTKTLAAYYWEPIAVDTVWQAEVDAEAEIHWLDVKVGEPVLERRVNLRGATTGRLYARAFSVIRIQLLPEPLYARIRDGSMGVGELLRDCGLETYRQLLEIGVTDSTHDLDAHEPHIYRTYRIALAGQPAILVTEHFPERLYSEGVGEADLLMSTIRHDAE